MQDFADLVVQRPRDCLSTSEGFFKAFHQIHSYLSALSSRRGYLECSAKVSGMLFSFVPSQIRVRRSRGATDQILWCFE